MANDKQEPKIEQDSYQLLKKRLEKYSNELSSQLNNLNSARKDVFGSVETTLISTDRVTTSNNCLARDMIPIGTTSIFIFGYNVHMGLKKEIEVSDVFSKYRFQDNQFHTTDLDSLSDDRFIEDFKNLYRYYKHTQFAKFAIVGPYLYMIFQVGSSVSDIKAFKWQVVDNQLKYIDNRSDHEFQYPVQHEFNWIRTTRDMQRKGTHPHISIEDQLFIETINGNLTLKIEDNTESGEGIFSEKVEVADQTLDDAEIHYAIVNNIIVLKIRPYQETKYRYIVYSNKIKQAIRIDTLQDSCILLPDDHGLIFAKGYYLQTGVSKLFEYDMQNMLFEKRITSPNGEDYLYVFYHQKSGMYILLSYNIILQEVATPIFCNGYVFFKNGQLLFFKNDNEQRKHHAIQIWQTPYYHPDFEVNSTNKDSIIYKIGNKDIVKAMAESNEILTLIAKEDSYNDLYVDLVRKSTEVLDAYHWIHNEGVCNLSDSITQIKQTSLAAIAEYEKVSNVKNSTKKKVLAATNSLKELKSELRKQSDKDIDFHVHFLAKFRKLRGEIIGLKDLRYADLIEVQKLEDECLIHSDQLAISCVEHLLQDDALLPYQNRVKNIESQIAHVAKVADAKQIEDDIQQVANELDLLIEIVSNLKIDDATQVTEIIDRITQIYSSFNLIKSNLKKKRQELAGVEAKAEFYAQLNLIDQGLINYLDLANTPQKADEYLTKLSIQIQELESRFADFDEFINLLTAKYEEVFNNFESHKLQLIEKRSKKANSLQNAAERIINGIKSRIENLSSVNEIHAFFAGDLMVEKVRNIIQQLYDIDDSVKADDIESKLKLVKNDSTRQLKDKTELFSEQGDQIKLGNHSFAVNKQNLDATTVIKNNKLYFHLTGTNFYEEIKNDELNQLKDYWEQSYVSENQDIYRAEYLCFKVFEKLKSQKETITDEQIADAINNEIKSRFQEGYIKGIHDQDAFQILKQLLNSHQLIGLLSYTSQTRALAAMFWNHGLSNELKEYWNRIIKATALLNKVFKDSAGLAEIQEELTYLISEFSKKTQLFEQQNYSDAASYLLKQLSNTDHFIIDKKADKLYLNFLEFLKTQNQKQAFENSLNSLKDNITASFILCKTWLKAYTAEFNKRDFDNYIDEVAHLIINKAHKPAYVNHSEYTYEINGLKGEHNLINNGTYHLNYHNFINKLNSYCQFNEKQFIRLQQLKKELVASFKAEVKLNEYKPKVMSSFVRNRLIDELYLPIIGDNLAKQIGASGANKRTDLMGMLLLISPPGYGKTTLMEYIANRLGIIFMKINGPAIGHNITSVDPSEASNAAARQELMKLNLAFEMGDNIMIYLDDIQHCNPEFLQKFISLCDATRKIEGVYKGKSKTYDFRGKKACVVMAGNPYTESGAKFQIPDMLANRADIYNLGDIIGDTEEIFKLSYIENSLTSNQILGKLASKSMKDVHHFIKMAQNKQADASDLELDYSADEMNEYLSTLNKMLRIRDVVFKVNQQYIESAAQANEYRTEPAFKLQGSYRDMNKLAEKVVPLMNDNELETLILSHYENESQTLTSNSEANMLKLKTLINKANSVEIERWEHIKNEFAKTNRMNNMGKNNQVAELIFKMSDILGGLKGIEEALNQDKYFLKVKNIQELSKNKKDESSS